MYDEGDLLPISGIQHLLFCERQCALIHVEQAWGENRLTAEGRLMHDRVHDEGAENRRDVRSARGVRLRSLRLGLAGKADVVEFHRCDPDAGGAAPDDCARLPDCAGWWKPFPVEHKRGAPKADHCDWVQLCAQALCLEEMLGISVPAGAIYYGRPHRRQDVVFTPDLRRETEEAAARFHELVRTGLTPAAKHDKKCDRCSLVALCLPEVGGGTRSARKYLEESIRNR